MSTVEIWFRAALLLIGFVTTMVGAAMAWQTDREVTPLVVLVWGALCTIASTQGVS